MCWQIHHALRGAAGVGIARDNPARLLRETPSAYPPAFAPKAVTAVIPATGKPERQADNLKAGFGPRQPRELLVVRSARHSRRDSTCSGTSGLWRYWRLARLPLPQSPPRNLKLRPLTKPGCNPASPSWRSSAPTLKAA